jgi:hypothetical protein
VHDFGENELKFLLSVYEIQEDIDRKIDYKLLRRKLYEDAERLNIWGASRLEDPHDTQQQLKNSQ